MKENKAIRKRIVTICTVMTLVAAMIPSIGSVDTYAATKVKTPSAPKITAGTAEASALTVKWNKASNAKGYQIALRTSHMGWKYYKTVKKTAANKKAFNQPKKYKTVAKKGKFKVYKYQTIYSYTTLKSKITSKSYTYNAPKQGTSYTLAVRALNRNKHSKWVTKSVTSWDKDTLRIDGVKHTHKWEPVKETQMTTVKENVVVGYNEIEKKVGIQLTCNSCSKVLDILGDEDGEYTGAETFSEERIAELVAKHRAEDNCSCEAAPSIEGEEGTARTDATVIEDYLVTVKEPIYELQDVEKPVDVVVSYKCNCHATKTLEGDVTLHQHVWTEKSHVDPTCTDKGKIVYSCECGKENVKEIPAIGHNKATRTITKMVEDKNQPNYVSHEVCKDCGYTVHGEESIADHVFWEVENGGTGSTYTYVTIEGYKTVPVHYTETYCTTCNKVLGTVKK